MNRLYKCFLLLFSVSLFFLRGLAVNSQNSNMDSLHYLSDQLELIMTNRSETWYKKCHSDLFLLLNELSFAEGKIIRIELPRKDGCGDMFHVFVVDSTNNNDMDYIRGVKLMHITKESCWQWLLLSRLNHFLPAYLHGAYYKEIMVLTEEKWHKILELNVPSVTDSAYYHEEIEAGIVSQSQKEKMMNQRIPPLKIRFNEKTRIVDISFCTWNNWKGLILNKYRLHVMEDKTVTISDYSTELLISYYCGLLF